MRFWEYDEALEIPFFVEADALYHIDPKATKDELSLLNAFDLIAAGSASGRSGLFPPRRATGKG